MDRRRDIIGLAVAVLGSEAVGGLSAVAAGGDFVKYYDSLRKPPATPPPAAFGPVWTTLYLLMAVAAWLVWREGLTRQSALALGLFAAQLTYLGWVSVAAYLNAGIWWLNPAGSADRPPV